ncbi:hypothetical protein [Paraburkholderia guartelaensis]|jgi:hypothetical protein|uniref:hypothetical protein n=1 Tax=Paraburkholderia guartelaensis TaxID=2546446 RepID=UPI001409A39D|nr:hypothetical protein [Paraburkholderia guartelaensis]
MDYAAHCLDVFPSAQAQWAVATASTFSFDLFNESIDRLRVEEIVGRDVMKW